MSVELPKVKTTYFIGMTEPAAAIRQKNKAPGKVGTQKVVRLVDCVEVAQKIAKTSQKPHSMEIDASPESGVQVVRFVCKLKRKISDKKSRVQIEDVTKRFGNLGSDCSDDSE